MARAQPLFEPGDVVQRVNQPERVGVVRERRYSDQTETWNYVVQFGTEQKSVPETAIQELERAESVWDAMSSGQFSGIDHFRFVMTYHRLRRPMSRIAHSFSTSRTQFYPHQFKPLLKFLDNPGRRLLIADDVGLGKTIEAGYVLRELDTRARLQGVVIVVPARLRTKWKRELELRFGEIFEVVSARELVGLGERMRSGKELGSFRWIVSYESARAPDVISAIRSTQPSLDLVIFDEAHRMRNEDTLQHRVGSELARCAEVALFLSATPVQNKLEDLWNLFRLLSPEEFPLFPAFEEQLGRNRPLLEAQHALARKPTDVATARVKVGEFFGTNGAEGRHGAAVRDSIEGRLASDALSRADLIELQADLGRLSPIGHMMCRTRRAEALVHRPIRYPVWKSVRLSRGEREVYDRVESICRQAWCGEPDSWGFQMSLLMAYRATASCLPAALRYFEERLRFGVPADFNELIEEDVEENARDEERMSDIGAWPKELRAYLVPAIESYRHYQGADTKFQNLLEALRLIREEDDSAHARPRKVVVFSFFRRTLEYLAARLTTEGHVTRMIHGGIDIATREASIEDFLSKGEVRILLTSEVGGEGIDLQEASVIVNYDLPWNPMVVEQRIGRLDRIGQESERIVIVNLVVADSIEERILQRLLDKIGIFRDSIGELDPIIGSEIENLTQDALRGRLTIQEQAQLAEEKGEILHRRMQQAREMLLRVDDLLAADQGIIDEIDAVTGERHIPAPRELSRFLNRLFADMYPGCQVPMAAEHSVVSMDLRGGLAQAIELEASEMGQDMRLFARKISTGKIETTFSREAAYRHPRAELLNMGHPLVKFAVQQVSRSHAVKSKTFCIAIPGSKHLDEGLYAFLAEIVEVPAEVPKTRFVVVFADVSGPISWTDQDVGIKVLLEMLDSGDDVAPVVLTARGEELKSRLTRAMEEVVVEMGRRERELDLIRREARHRARCGAAQLRLARAKERLERLLHNRASEFPVRMARAKLARAMDEWNALVEGAPAATWEGLTREEVALGFLKVGLERTT